MPRIRKNKSVPFSLLIEDYHQGNFGLTLSAYQAPAPFTPPTLSEGESLSWGVAA